MAKVIDLFKKIFGRNSRRKMLIDPSHKKKSEPQLKPNDFRLDCRGLSYLFGSRIDNIVSVSQLMQQDKIKLLSPKGLSQQDIDIMSEHCNLETFSLYNSKGDFDEENDQLNLDFSELKTDAFSISNCNISNLVFPRSAKMVLVELDDINISDTGCKFNFPEGRQLEALKVIVDESDITDEFIKALAEVKGNSEILITMCKYQENDYKKYKYTFSLDDIMTGKKKIEDVKETLDRIIEDPDYMFKMDPRYSQYQACVNGKKMEDLNDNMVSFINIMFPPYDYSDSYFSGGSKSIVTEESLEYRKQVYEDGGTKSVRLPAKMANEFVDNEKLRDLLDVADRIVIDFKDEYWNEKYPDKEFDLKLFIDKMKEYSYELCLACDDISKLDDELLEFISGRVGIKIFVKKLEGEGTELNVLPADMIIDRVSAIDRNKVREMDVYDGGKDLIDIKKCFAEISSKVPKDLPISEKVPKLYEALREKIQIESMIVDPEYAERYKSIYGCFRNKFPEEVEKDLEGKVIPKIEYQSIAETLKSGHGNPKDFLDVMLMLMRANGIDVIIHDDADLIMDSNLKKDISGYYTDEYATPPNSVMPIRVRTFEYKDESGESFRIKKFVNELEITPTREPKFKAEPEEPEDFGEPGALE